MPSSLSHAAGSRSLTIRPFDAPLGAEVLGLDLSRPLDPEDFARLHRAHLDHHVLVFRDQRITPAQQVEFSRRFGPLQIHVLHQFQLAGHPEVLVVSNIVEDGRPIGLGDAGHFWHSDLSYRERPSLGSMLHAQELPAEGGDTVRQPAPRLGAPARLAAPGRGAPPRRALVSVQVRGAAPAQPVAAAAQRAQQVAQVRPVDHPLVRTHPETGRKALFVSEHFTTRVLGLPEDESRALLDELFAFGTRPEFIYRHRWRSDDMVFWDNRSVMHLAAGCPDHLRRRLYRTTIEGDVPR